MAVLVGRTDECEFLTATLDDARKGVARAVVISGESGIGKSALLRHVTVAAAASGFTVARAQGIESEAEIAFAGLADITRPFQAGIAGLPEVQARALGGSLALGPPAGGERFVVATATLGLLAAAADSAPLLLVIDDAHWLDRPSAEAITFVARRLVAERIACLIAVRDGEPSAMDCAGLTRLPVHGLGVHAAKELLDRRPSPPMAAEVRERLIDGTGGNPLALIEAADALSPAQRDGRAPIAEPLPTGTGIEQAFLRRLDPLPADCRAMLLLAAAGHGCDLRTIRDAGRRLGADPASIETAEATGLIAIDALRLEFRHPLIRSALYHAAPSSERRAVHRALAQALASHGDEERQAWHLCLAAEGHDEQVATLLERTAVSARDRTAYATASKGFERAASLSADLPSRHRRLVGAAAVGHLAGQLERADSLLDEALGSVSTPLERAEIQHLRGCIGLWRTNPRRSSQMLVEEAERIIGLHPDKAALMMADAVAPAMAGGDVMSALAIGERACLIARHGDRSVQRLVNAIRGAALVAQGRGADGYAHVQASPMFEEMSDFHFTGSAPSYHVPVTHACVWAGDWARGEVMLDRAVGKARALSVIGLLPFLLGVRSELNFRTGKWDAALSDAVESVILARQSGEHSFLPFALVAQSVVHAGRGDRERCQRTVEEAVRLADLHETLPARAYAAASFGLLELGLGRPGDAVPHFEAVAELMRGAGVHQPGVIQWQADHVEACLRAGSRPRGLDVLATFEREAEASGNPWALGASARCRALFADPARVESHLARADELFGRLRATFEQARTDLCRGELLRRARQRVAARGHLSRALSVFDRLRAGPWADRTRAELEATGAPARRRETSAAPPLTAQELQVAKLAAEGEGNREIATALFLSRKTVEFHIGNLHRKLGTTSRARLVRKLLEHSLMG